MTCGHCGMQIAPEDRARCPLCGENIHVACIIDHDCEDDDDEEDDGEFG